VLLVPGADPTHPPELVELYRRHLPHATVRIVDAPWHTADLATPIAAFLDAIS
jgi:hypothetical protein